MFGILRPAVQTGRERNFAYLYRASDAVRQLNDAGFRAALKFMRASFEFACCFVARLQSAQ